MKAIGDQAFEHVEHRAVDIGSRPNRSAANRAASDYICETFAKCSLVLETQPIPCPDWTAEHTSRELNGETLEASANTFSPTNIDGVGPFTGTTTVTSFVASPAFQTLLDETLEAYPGVIKVEPWPASDHYIFYSHGVPSLALTGKEIRDLYHTSSDTIEWISSEKPAEATQLVLDVFKELDRKDEMWRRPKNSDGTELRLKQG